MHRSLAISCGFHIVMIILTILSLPFLGKPPIDLPPLISVELIQITDKTNIPFAPKAKKIIEKIKKEKKFIKSIYLLKMLLIALSEEKTIQIYLFLQQENL